MFDADRPIITSQQDRLGRSIFAKYLARCMLDHASIESLIIGLYGGWGSGKTSMINLTLEELRFASSNMLDQEKPIILNFSPWSYSGQGQLIYSFFRRLSAEMRQAVYFENAASIIHLLELYISFFTHKPVPKNLRPKHSWVGRLLHQNVVAEETIGWESGKDLTLVKAELNQLLAKHKHKIIIFIDNINRLEDKEINEILQIVKSIGDIANTIYVLVLDPDRVVAALDKELGGGGGEFLKKVIQLPFEIPPISKQDIEVLLFDRLQKILVHSPENSWQKEYWADIYYSSLKYLFKNIRDITCYVNTLSFVFEHVKEVVNPVDLFAITAVQVFEKDVFYGIRDNKDLFADLAEDVSQPDAQKLAEDKIRCDEILHRTVTLPREWLQQLLIKLFPRLRGIYQPSVPFYHSEILARKNKRICSLDTFDIYFRSTVSTGYISKEEMGALLKLSSDTQGFGLALLRLNQDNRILKFLDLLDGGEAYHIPVQHIEHVICALLDSGDFFPEGENTALSFNTYMRIHRIFQQLLWHFPSSEQRFKIFYKAIKETVNSIYIIIHELSVQQRAHMETEDTYLPEAHRDFTTVELNELKVAAVNRIIAWAELGRLVEHPKLLSILLAWSEWGDEEECRQYIIKMTQEDKGLLAFLLAVFHEPIKEALEKGLSESDPSWSKYISNLEAFIAPQELVPHAKTMFESESFEKLRDTEQLALLIFLNSAAPDTVKTFPKTTV